MRLLVTGGLGFIGSNLIRHMLDNYREVKVTNIDKQSHGSNPANLSDYERDERYRFVKGDIADKELVEKLVRDVDIIINFAAETHVDRSIANPRPFLESNVEGTLSILEAMRQNAEETKLVHVSTDEVYGDIPEGSFTDEDRLKPSSPYAASKAAADMFCLAYHRTYGLPVVVTRCTNNFGPYQSPEKLIPKTIIRASMGLKTPIYGSGKNVRDWIYVLDFSEAIDLLLREGESGEIYNISAGNELRNLDLVRTILKIMGKPEDMMALVEDRPGHDLRYSLDSSKARSKLGWRPRHSFQDSLARTVDWYIKNEWWWKPLISEEILHPTPWKLKW